MFQICFIYFYLAFRINDNDSTTTYIIDSTTTWLCNMHVVPIKASSPQLIEHRLSTWYEWSSIQQSIKPSTYIYEWLYIQQGIKPSTLYEWFYIQQGIKPPTYMSMHGLNNLINNDVRHRRLDNINDKVRHQRQRQQQHTASTTRTTTTTTTTSTTTYNFNNNDNNVWNWRLDDINNNDNVNIIIS